jgi:hypothetical protein
MIKFYEWVEARELDEKIRLYHGTDAISAGDIVKNGLNRTSSGVFNSAGEFWASPSNKYAYWFAKTNPREIDDIAIVSFELPKRVLSQILKSRMAIKHSPVELEFLPQSFELINSNMANANIEAASEELSAQA